MAMSNKTLRPRVSGFNPKSISGLYAWYDAADATTITQATGVSSWADKSGNGRTCSQPTGANQPAYVLAGQNGKNVIDFASASKNMITNGTAWGLTSTNTMFWSFQFPDTAASAAGYTLFDFTVTRQMVYGNSTSELRIANAVTGITPVSRRRLKAAIRKVFEIKRPAVNTEKSPTNKAPFRSTLSSLKNFSKMLR